MKIFIFWGVEEGFFILVFFVGVKGGDRFFIFGGSFWYSVGIEKEVYVIKWRSIVYGEK